MALGFLRGDQPQYWSQLEFGKFYLQAWLAALECLVLSHMNVVHTPTGSYHEDKHPGMVTEEAVVTEVNNTMGQHYWKAVAPIGSLFGHKVEGELEGIGRTRDEALKRLADERSKLYESLWA